MGIILEGTHYVFPEEGVWLLEAGQAAILFNGYPFSVQQGYQLLASSQISFPKYLVYSYLKRAGYIVLPSNRNVETSDVSIQSSSNKNTTVKSHQVQKFPQDLLDQFPSISSEESTFVDLYRKSAIAEKFTVSPEFPCRSASAYSFTPRRKEKLRPFFWPRFDAVCRSVESWEGYREEIRKIISRKRPSSGPYSALPQPDYDIYVTDGTYSHTFPPPPLFQLYVFENWQFGLPSQYELYQLSCRVCKGKLVIAVVQNATILFYDADHRSIQL
ncbi:unnamed protein product [Enterobius vermicularis]|uniref:tRNA_int_end_N2 domain-containing protein n=1 Tax=Enterobius vermicularis TaxID=51028 RepID=A0A0N4UY14_ENTVE|nr:unnamed protein product [Enterobius vermicularis]